MMKIGILGGSFNPPHLGHLYIAQKVYEEFSMDAVLLLPLGTPPHKGKLASRKAREVMCRLTAQAGTGIKVSTMELERDGYTYTVDTLRQLKREQPQYEPYYIIGTDTLFRLESWREYEQVLQLTEFICVPRPGDDMQAVQQKIMYFKQQYGKEIRLCSHSGPQISSTGIREAVTHGQSTEGMLVPAVRAYIDEEKLYAD